MKRVSSMALVCGGLFLAVIAFSFWIGSAGARQEHEAWEHGV